MFGCLIAIVCWLAVAAHDRYNSSGTINLRFEAAYDGVLRFDRAEVRAWTHSCWPVHKQLSVSVCATVSVCVLWRVSGQYLKVNSNVFVPGRSAASAHVKCGRHDIGAT